MSNRTRLSLLERLQNSSSDESWREFCAMYETLIEQWLLREGLQPADVDDIRQEVMTTVLAEIGQFRHSGRVGAFRTWLRRVVVHRLRRHWTRKTAEQKRQAPVDLATLADELADDDSRLSAEWALHHDQHLLAECMAVLRKRFQPTSIAVFQRVAINQESAQDVARDMNMTLGAVRVAQHRVLKALKKLANGLLD